MQLFQGKRNQDMQSNRNIINDFLRGGATIAVVLGHIIQILSETMDLDYFSNPVAIFIISINMPLFAMISGFYASKKTGLFQGLKKVKRLAIPLLAWTTIYYVYLVGIRIVAGHGIRFDITEFVEYLISPYYWFLWALIIIIITVNLAEMVISKLVHDNMAIRQLLFIMISIIIMAAFSAIKVPNWQYAWFLFPFYIVGYVVDIDKIEKTITVKHTTCLGILFVLALFIYKREWLFYVSGTSILDTQYGMWKQLFFNCARTVIGIVGCFFIMGLVSCLTRNQKKNHCHGLATVGRNSLKIYCIQNLVVSVVFKFAVNIFIDRVNVTLTEWEVVAVSVILTVLMMAVINMIISIIMRILVLDGILFGQ